MLIDLQTEHPPAADALRADVCIVGGGLAGLTLAQAFVDGGVSVILLEAGGVVASAGAGDPFDDVRYTEERHQGTAEGRVRALGGSSAVWGAQLLPLPGGMSSAEEFELDEGQIAFTQATSRDGQWPLPQQALAPFLGDAELLLRADALPYEAATFFSDPGAHKRKPVLPRLLAQLQGFDARVSKFAPFRQRNLAQVLGKKLREHRLAKVLLHAQVTSLEVVGGRVAAAAVAMSAPGLKVEARHFIVAAGTVETCRLLLASRLGGENVGLGLHDHLTVTAATVTGAARERLLFEMRPWMIDRTMHSVKLEASDSMRRRLSLTPAMAHLVIDEPAESGVGALRQVLRDSQQDGVRRAIGKALPMLPAAFFEGAKLWGVAILDHRRYVSSRATVALRINVAQEVSPENRIVLDPQSDSSGMPGVRVEWAVREPERRTLRRFTQELKRQLAEAGLESGLEWNPVLLMEEDAPLPPLDDARHAMGGAIMGVDPRTSVVTPELQVHGVQNLWIASPAVFPDGSAQLPGLTLMALCLRLAEQLTDALMG